MRLNELWKNFDLGTELHIAGASIYNGIRHFHEMQTLENTDEVFEFLYNLSVGLERLLKVAVVLLEHDGCQDQEKFERSLITHNHLELLRRIKRHIDPGIHKPHNEFLSLLSAFYKTLRYRRFGIREFWNPADDKSSLRKFIENSLQVKLNSSTILAVHNEDRFRRYVGKIVTYISGRIYRIITDRADEINLYTYELRHGSKAEMIFLRGCEFFLHDVLWKELLVFFMNTKSDSEIFKFLRKISPLDFDVACATEYLLCFQSEEAKALIMGELEELYSCLTNPRRRLDVMGCIGNTDVFFDDGADDTADD